MSLLETMREKRAAKKTELEELLAAAETREVPELTDEEFEKIKNIRSETESMDSRIAELEVIERNRTVEAETRKMTGGTPTGTAQVKDAPVYVPNGGNGESYFRDLGQVALNKAGADVIDRLHRNAVAFESEFRALGNTNAAGGSGGEFAPPAWLVNQWLTIIRKGRVTPDLYEKMDVPAGVSSINIPKITGGTTTALQSTQNSALSQTDMTTSYIQASWATVGGKQVVAQQLLDQTAVNFDQIILKDLAADYAQQVGALAFTGSGGGTGTNSVVNGLLNATFGTTQTWTQASPTAALFYSQTGDMLQKFLVKRLANPTCWLMHPRRWYWLSVAVDGQGRPLVVPDGPGFNQMAAQDGPTAFGRVGTMHGLPVYIDPQVPINQGGGTNQDLVYLLKTDDLLLLESGPRAETFRETYADSVGVLFRLYAYVGTVLNRHTESLAVMTGTGLIAPTFLG